MNALGIALMWCFVQVTVLSIVVGGLYLIARRLLPAAGVPILLTGLGAVVVLSALALSPWPQWVSCAQPVSIDDNSVALVSENLPVGPSVDSSTEPPSSSTARQDPRHRERPPAKIANLARQTNRRDFEPLNGRSGKRNLPGGGRRLGDTYGDGLRMRLVDFGHCRRAKTAIAKPGNFRQRVV